MLFFHLKPLFIDIWNIYFHSSHRYCQQSNSSHPEHHRRHWHCPCVFIIYFILWHFCFHFPMNFFFLHLPGYPTLPDWLCNRHTPFKFWFWFEFLFWLAKLTHKKNINLGQNLLACWVIIGWFPFPNEHFPPILCFVSRVRFGAQSWTADFAITRQLTSTRKV